jgi:hypothetical protein
MHSPEFEKEMSFDIVKLSDSWTAKLIQAGTRQPKFRFYCSVKREEQMLTRMDRNFGDSI